MEDLYTVKLSKVIKEFALESIYLSDLPENIEISCSSINRPGLQMVGFYDHYEASRLQIIGKVEHLYIETLSDEERNLRLEDFFKSRPVGVIFAASLNIRPEIVDLAEKYRVPLLRSSKSTSDLVAAMIAFLNV